MENFIAFIIWFQRTLLLRNLIGIVLQVSSLVALNLRPFKPDLSRRRYRFLIGLTAAGMGFFALFAAAVEHWYYPDTGNLHNIGPILCSVIFRVLSVMTLFVYYRLIPQKRELKIYTFLYVLNFRLFLALLTNLYTINVRIPGLNQTYPYRFDVLLFYSLITAVSYPLFRHLLDAKTDLIRYLNTTRFPAALYAIPLSGCVVLTAIYIYIVFQRTMSLYQNLLVIAVLVVFATYFALTFRILSGLALNQRNQTQFTHLLIGLNQIQSNMDDIRQLKHDFKHHLAAIQLYLDQGRQNEANQYILNLINRKELTCRVYYCADGLVNSILNYCMLQADGLPVQLSADIGGPTYEPLNQMELTTVLTNLMSNAIEALRRIQPPAPPEAYVIALAIRTLNDYLLISCRNRLPHPIQLSKSMLPATEKDNRSHEHGHGLHILLKLTHDHGGRMDLDTGDGCFTVTLCLPKNQGVR